MTRIEYQKEMDPEKDGVKPKPEKATNIPTVDVSPEPGTQQVMEIDEKSVMTPKPADIEYYYIIHIIDTFTLISVMSRVYLLQMILHSYAAYSAHKL